MKTLLLSIITSRVFAQIAQVQIVHNSPSPTVDIYVDGIIALEDVAYRASTGLVDLPTNTELGIAPADGDFLEYLQVSVEDYTLDIPAHGDTNPVESFSAPLSSFCGKSGVVYASGLLSPSETDSGFNLVLTTPSGYVVNPPGTGTALATENLKNTVPNSFVLLQNFPNPFNTVRYIPYHLTSVSPVALTIYDLPGNKFSNLFSGIEGSGYKSINWDATNNNGDLVSSGMYFYKLQVGELFEIKRMMYMK